MIEATDELKKELRDIYLSRDYRFPKYDETHERVNKAMDKFLIYFAYPTLMAACVIWALT